LVLRQSVHETSRFLHLAAKVISAKKTVSHEVVAALASSNCRGHRCSCFSSFYWGNYDNRLSVKRVCLVASLAALSKNATFAASIRLLLARGAFDRSGHFSLIRQLRVVNVSVLEA